MSGPGSADDEPPSSPVPHVVPPEDLAVPAGRSRLFDWLRGSPAGLVPLALLVGAGAGGGAVLFRYLIIWVTEAATGRSDYSNAGHVASPHFPALGSTIGQRLKVPETRLRLLVACGDAGGISATFNAPIAGVFFALELILRDFQTEAFGVVVLSSVTADIIGRAVFGSHAFLALPGLQVRSSYEYLLFALLGVVAAVVGVGFIEVLYGMEDLFDRFWPGPDWLRPATGGVVLGLLLLVLPEMYGVGYPVLEGGGSGATTPAGSCCCCWSASWSPSA